MAVNNLINPEELQKAMQWFLQLYVSKTNCSTISFSDGWLENEEGYKKSLYKNAHKALAIDTWGISDIGSGRILANVIAAMKAQPNNGKNNIVDFHSITKFQDTAEKDLQGAEDILFHLFTDESPAGAFDKACCSWGKWYPELSYLLFVRDADSYVPVKTDNHKKRFKKLGISTACLNQCSWDNYNTFLKIHEEIRQQLSNFYGIPVSLLDAHSFIWMTYNEDETFPCEEPPEIKMLVRNTDPFESVVIKGDKEGKKIEYYTAKYERSSRNRAAAIKIHGYCCAVCGFNFSEVYGNIGKDFIEVHHAKPLHSLTDEVIINPETDLVCLCSNCHRMIHRKRGAIVSVEELKQALCAASFRKA